MPVVTVLVAIVVVVAVFAVLVVVVVVLVVDAPRRHRPREDIDTPPPPPVRDSGTSDRCCRMDRNDKDDDQHRTTIAIVFGGKYKQNRKNRK